MGELLNYEPSFYLWVHLWFMGDFFLNYEWFFDLLVTFWIWVNFWIMSELLDSSNSQGVMVSDLWYWVCTLTRGGEYGEIPAWVWGSSRGRSPRELPRPNAGIFCTPRLKSRYRHYQIYKSNEAVAIVLAIAMSRAIAMSKPRAKKEYNIFLVWFNNNNNNSFSLSIIYSHSNSHSYSIAKSLIIAIAKAKLFPKLQLQAKLKTRLYLKTGLD